MLTDYFRIAIRHLFRRRFYSFLNIFGLSIGLTAAAITVLYVRHELGYDGFHPESARTYRISGLQENSWFAFLSRPYSDAVYQGNFPEVEKVARVRRWYSKFIRNGNEKFYEPNVLLTDPGTTFFEVFDFPFIAGDPRTALQQRNSVVLTASLAKKLFKDQDPIGRPVLYDSFPLTVTGVIKDLPSNTHFTFRALVANAAAMQDASAIFTYCVLRKDADPAAFKTKLLALPKPANHFDVLKDAAILPITKLHFDGNMTYEMKPAGSRLYVLLFNLIGWMIVLLSCTNYMNLSVALYAERRKEIAVRKVAGAGNLGLALQFLTEAVTLCLVCLPLTILLLGLALPVFNGMMQMDLHNEFVRSLPAFGLLLGITIGIGLVSGSYPAWVLPKLKTAVLFRNQSIMSRGGWNLRQVLVTFQVTVLVAIISAAWIMHNQLEFLRQKDVGFTKEAVLKLKGAWLVDSTHYSLLKNALLQSPDIKNVSMGFTPGDEEYGFPFRADNSSLVHPQVISVGTDEDYLSTLGIQLLQADFMTAGKTRPRKYMLINETAARQLGYKDPVGRKIVLQPGTPTEGARTINGVVKDFNFFSLHRPAVPVILYIRPFGSGVNENILVKLQGPNIPRVLDFIHKTTDALLPDIPLTTEFLDEALERHYGEEQRLSSLTGILMGVTLLLSVIGLVGLASYTAELRTKEIGVRKVLGATIPDILRLLSYSFVRITGIAIITGSAVSLLFMDHWLRNFAYRSSISWTVFAGTTVLLLLVIVGSVAGHSLKAAFVNPVKLLRTE